MTNNFTLTTGHNHHQYHGSSGWSRDE